MNGMAYVPLWLISGILYGLSWPICPGVNLSFLAWFAFVPLFVYLHRHRTSFWKSMTGSYAAIVVFGCFSAGWLFHFPQKTAEIALIFFMELFWIFIPFGFFYFVQKRMGFDRALWLFPVLWMVWEWIYLHLEFTMGTHLSPYSQSSNVWLIQYIDITGMWGISFWLMLFNVWLYKTWRKRKFVWSHPGMVRQTSMVALTMICIPLAYGIFALSSHDVTRTRSIEVGIVPTHFEADYMNNPANGIEIVNQTLHRNDSLAFTMQDRAGHIDLYVWPETGSMHGLDYSNLGTLLHEAVHDWEGALVLGCKTRPMDSLSTDLRSQGSGVLVSARGNQPAYHHKTVLTPGQESIPYHDVLAQIPGFPIPLTHPRYLRKGTSSQPLELTTRDGQQWQLGVSLCFEQWYPHHWVKMASNGADFMVHLAGEGWYGDVGFQQFMANVTRLRSIETRRQTAQSANVGVSTIIDQMGRITVKPTRSHLDFIQGALSANDTITWYVRHPDWFPVLGLIGLVMGMIMSFKAIFSFL